MTVDVLWELDEPDDEALVEACRVAGQTLLEATGHGARDLAVLLTSDEGIRALNLTWRGEDRPTDVLSFAMDEGEELEGPPGEPPPLGDVAISLETARRQASDLGQSPRQEVLFLLVHSVCHLLGHDHGEAEEARRMRSEEDRLLAIVAPGQVRHPTPY